MCKQISTEYVLGSILYFHPEGVTVSDLNNFEQKVYNQNEDLIIDISRNAIISVVESCCEYFRLENDVLLLREYYLDNMPRIKNRFVDVLDENFKNAMIEALV